MKINKETLKKIILEEIKSQLNERPLLTPDDKEGRISRLPGEPARGSNPFTLDKAFDRIEALEKQIKVLASLIKGGSN